MSENTIHFDFEVCETAVKELEGVAERLRIEYETMQAEDVHLLYTALCGEAGELLADNYLGCAERLKALESKLLEQCEEMNRAARKAYAIEQEAKRIAMEEEGK